MYTFVVVSCDGTVYGAFSKYERAASKREILVRDGIETFIWYSEINKDNPSIVESDEIT